jgi:hypothetical protein
MWATSRVEPNQTKIAEMLIKMPREDKRASMHLQRIDIHMINKAADGDTGHVQHFKPWNGAIWTNSSILFPNETRHCDVDESPDQLRYGGPPVQ